MEPQFDSDPVDERVALSRACRAYLDADIRDPAWRSMVETVYSTAQAMLIVLDDGWGYA